MNTLAFIGCAILGSISINASPMPVFTPIAPNTATCNVGISQGTAAGIYYQTYDVHIGAPYNGGAGCQSVHDRLASAVTGVLEKWQCVDDGVGQTETSFRTGGAGISSANIAVVDALQEMYPNVPFHREGICLSITTPKPDGW